MANQATHIKCVLHLSHPHGGWSEVYNFPQQTYSPQAMTNLQKLVQLRSYWMAVDVQITYARLSLAGIPKDAQAFDGLPVWHKHVPKPGAPLSSGLYVNDIWTGPQFRFETAEGRWGIRIFRGVWDDMVGEMRVSESSDLELREDGTNVDPFGNATQHSKMKTFLYFLKTETCYVRKTTGATPYDVRSWNRVLFRRLGKRDTGRPFGLFHGRAKTHAAA